MKDQLFKRVLASIRILAVSFCVLAFTPQAFTQEPTPILPDTTKITTIPKDRIPIASGESIIRAKKMAGTLIKDERISTLKKENDSLMTFIDTLLAYQKRSNMQALSNRVLKNLLNNWQANKTIVEKEKEKLSSITKTLNDKQNTLENELDRWNNTRKKIRQEEAAASVMNLINEVTYQIDSVNALMQAKSNMLFQLLENTARRSVEVEEIINRIRDLIEEQQTHLFSKNQPSFFAFDYSKIDQWHLGKYLKEFNDTELRVLIRYYQNNSVLFFYYFIYLAGLILLFLYFKRKIYTLQIELTSIYEENLKEILFKPISAALVLGLFSSLFFFISRPIILSDIAALLVSIPLIIIVITVGKNINLKYIYLFALLMVLRFINYILPTDIFFHRLIILIMGTIEIIVLYDLLRYLKKNPIIHRILNNFVYFLVVLHIAFAIVGMIGNIYGSVMLADMAVNLAVTNTFVGFLLFISAIIVIGLIHFAIDSNYFQRLHVVRQYGLLIKRQTIVLTAIVAVYFWITSVMKVLGIFDNITEYFTRVFTNEYRLGDSTFTIGSIVLFFLVIWLSVVISKIIRIVLEGDVLDKFSLKKGVPRMISVMTRYTLVVIGVFIAVSAAGMPLDRLTIIFGAFSVGIGFGLQNIFNNLVSGLILLFERPIQIGDVVEVGTLLGTVKSMGIRSSNLRTFDGAEVIVPNGHLISNEVTNWTLSDKRRRIEIFSGVAYGSDVHKVQKLFLGLLDEHPDVLKDPPPMVYFNDLGESSLDFRILFWTENFDEWQRIRSEVVFRIHDVLYAEGISIPFPQRDLHIKTIDGKVEIKDKGKDE